MFDFIKQDCNIQKNYPTLDKLPTITDIKSIKANISTSFKNSKVWREIIYVYIISNNILISEFSIKYKKRCVLSEDNSVIARKY